MRRIRIPLGPRGRLFLSVALRDALLPRLSAVLRSLPLLLLAGVLSLPVLALLGAWLPWGEGGASAWAILREMASTVLPGYLGTTIWLGLLNQKLGRTVWSAAGLQDSDAPAVLTAAQWQKLAHTAKHWRFEGLTPCSWKQAQTTGGGLALREVDQHFQFKGCPGLYFVGETLDCAGSCGGFNLHWAFGSGLVAGRSAAGHAAAGRALPKASAPAKSRKKPHR